MIAAQHESYSEELLSSLSGDHPGSKRLDFKLARRQTRNAARAMTAILCHRITKNSSHNPALKTNQTYVWKEGVFNCRNIADRDYMWTNLRRNVADAIHDTARVKPVAYLLACCKPGDTALQVWAIPEPLLYGSLSGLQFEEGGQKYTIEIVSDRQRIERCDISPDLTPYFRRFKLARHELQMLNKAREADDSAKAKRQTPVEEEEPDSEDGAGKVLVRSRALYEMV
jgi:hypothetical protein